MMANPLYGMAINNNPFSQIIQEAQKLKNSFNGNPREEVKKLLNSGAMSQRQFNQYSQMAQQIMQAMGK